MTTEITLPDGSIYSSSQLSLEEDLEDQRAFYPMVGVILNVNPSDDPDNLSAGVEGSDQKGWRHECRVLIMDANTEPNLILENVIIPPNSHCGVDNYEEDLPRGLLRSLDGQKLSEHFKDHDITRLDAEWCVVAFIGGSIDKPFITNWWHHPLNFHDPASSGQALKGNSLKQVDLQKNKLRKLRRINGVQMLVSPEGDVYLDTSEANSKLDVLPSVKRMGVKKGGSIQVNVKSTQQAELNWNTPVEGLKAGSTSTSRSREEALSHIKAPVKPVGNPKARETTRTMVRIKEYEALVRTSNLNIECQNTGAAGNLSATADDNVTVTSPDIRIGDATASEPAVLGEVWKSIMNELITAIEGLIVGTGVGPSTPPINGAALLEPIRSKINANEPLSDFIYVKKEAP